MKNKSLLFFVWVMVVCSACQSKVKDLYADTQNPIMPIHYSGGVMHLYLTDYLPELSCADSVEIVVDVPYSITKTAPMEYDMEGNGEMANMQVKAKDKKWDICILPQKEAVSTLVPIACTDSSLTVELLKDYQKVVWQVYLMDKLLSQEAIQYVEGSLNATITWTCCPANRSFIRVYAVGDGEIMQDVLVPLDGGKPVVSATQLNRHDDQAQVLYSLMIDRFANGNKENDWKMHSEEVLDIVDYQGGDIRGIEQKIKEGFFSQLGVTTIWISPITQNPWDAWGKYVFNKGVNKYDSAKTYTRYSGYHGYWPIYATALEKRFSTESELKSMLKTAHDHNINVILDYVANHMHISSPTLQEHPDWHTDSILPDGRRNFELWDEARLTTWFDVHIPTLDLERHDVCDPMTDSALYWLANYEFDGYRHDACKHIPECYWRLLTHKMKTRYPNRHLWMIGETYGSPELISTYVKNGMLNAQFDFNVYFTAIHAICGDQPMSDINRVIMQSCSVYGAHHTMGCISGNHDQVRFASLAGGGIRFSEDGKMEGWTREVGLIPADTPNDKQAQMRAAAYKKALLLEMLNLTIPGVPCIYQGDEYGEVGGNDPDNRHMMKFELSDEEQAFRNKVQELIKIRRNHLAMLYGQYIPIYQDDETIVFERRYMDETIRVTISRDNESTIDINGTRVFRE